MKKNFVTQPGFIIVANSSSRLVSRLKFCCALLLVLAVPLISGCSSFAYYMEAIDGHLELLSSERDIEDILKEKDLDADLREKLVVSQQIRDFASRELGLPDNDSYRTYADIGRDYAVWNVIAAKEFSIAPKQWCFMFTGCIAYRGYFSEEKARQYAGELKKEGYDVYVAGARAYSTLGWLDDPLLNTMMYRSEAYRAGIIFHELAHQQIYVDDDSAFNEAFATSVEQEGIRRWFMKKNQQAELQTYLEDYHRGISFRALLQATREKLQTLYHSDIPEDAKREKKQQYFAELKKNYQLWKKQQAYDGYDKWMSQDLNNAHLILIATYHELVPGFKRLLEAGQNDLEKYYQQVEKLAELDREKRHAALLDKQ